MAIINLQCNGLSQIQEMGELFDKQVNVRKESLKNNLRGSSKLPQAHQRSVR